MQDTARPVFESGTVDAAQGVAWWTEAWSLFMRNPGMWVLYGLATFFGMILLHFVPVIGGLAAALLTPVVAGGFMLAARKLEEGGTLEFGDLFAGFGPHLSSLIVLGVAALVFQLVVGLVAGTLGVGAAFGILGGAATQSNAGLAIGFGMMMFAVIVAVACGFVLSMLLWFAPALVVFDGIPPVDAMKTSFSACLRNIVPFLVYGLIGIVLSILAMIPIGLGMLVLGPLYGLSAYIGYRGVFGR